MIAALALAAVLLAGLMAFAWAVQRRTGQSGWIDTIWSFAVGIAGLAGLITLGGADMRWWLVLALLLAWSLRLGSHIGGRTHGAGDDPRYAALMAEWGEDAPRQLFIFLQIQALAGFVLVLAVLLAAANPAPAGPFTLAAAAVALAGLAGETIADRQLARFRARRIANGICEEGLWARSRHPNYFFEWLFWLGIALVAAEAFQRYPFGLAGLLAPAMMFWLLNHASGIPHLEAHMLRSRGEAYRAYQARVPAFFPRLFRTGGD